MPYNSLATVNPGDVLSSSAWGNQAKANEDYLFSGRAGQSIKRDNGADYTTTSTSFVDIDGTNLVITATISSGKAKITFSGTANNLSGSMAFDISVDGTRYCSGGNDGILVVGANSTTNVSFSVTVTGLSVGSHTFKPQWRASASTAHLYAGSGTAAQDLLVNFEVEEIG